MEKKLKVDPGNQAALLIYARAKKQLRDDKQSAEMYTKLIRDLESDKTEQTFENIYLLALAHYESSGFEACRKLLPTWMKQLNLSESGEEPHALAELSALYYLADEGEKAREQAIRNIDLTGKQNRAGDGINRTLPFEARQLGAISFDLEKSVADRCPHRMPDYGIFLDYCHYNVRGHILVGHILARRIAEIFRLPKPPDAKLALKTESEIRRDRMTDIPDLGWWAGADFWVTRLTDEFAGQEEHFQQKIEQHMAQNGESALDHIYLGNWIATAPMNIDEIRGGGAAQYYKALALDFDQKAARANLEYIKKPK